MQRSLTAVIALAAAAGFIGLAQAQTTSTPTATAPYSPAPSTQAPAPSATAPTATNPSAAPSNPSMAPSATQAAPQASAQPPAAGDSFWSHNLSQDEVRQAQQQLQAQGLYRGPVDGQVGSQMHRALAQFQQQNGLRQTGTIDEQTMARLGGGAAAGSSMPPAGSKAAPASSAPMTSGTAAPASTTSPIGAGGTSTGTPTATPSSTSTQPVTR